MRTIRCLAILAVIMTTAAVSGCGSLGTYPHPLTVNPGSVMGNLTFPNQVMAHTQYQITSNDFDIIGPVSGQGSSLSVLGLIGVGDNGYDNLWEAAKRLGADAVIDVRVDTQMKSVLCGFIFESARIQLAGTAIRWKSKAEPNARK